MTLKVKIYCDRCHRKGKKNHHRKKLFGGKAGSFMGEDWSLLAMKAGWWVGKIWKYCPACRQALNLHHQGKALEGRETKKQQNQLALAERVA